MTIEVRRMTVDQFEAFADTPENTDRLLELIDGEISEKTPTENHGIYCPEYRR
jgi:Uma2 family endonuclease